MKEKNVKVGIMPFKEYQQYTLGIACGEYKPKKNDPKIWFESIENCLQILSTKNIELLKLIERKEPDSIEALAKMSGRNKSNLSRTLKAFQRHHIVDFVERNRRKKPVALATQFEIQIGREFSLYSKRTFG
jgi:predicted transcriptional regulator